jgi:hypothetical protein
MRDRRTEFQHTQQPAESATNGPRVNRWACQDLPFSLWFRCSWKGARFRHQHPVFSKNVIADFNAFTADVNLRPRDQSLHVALRLVAERAIKDRRRRCPPFGFGALWLPEPHDYRPPNGWRLSGERAARVRCSRGLGAQGLDGKMLTTDTPRHRLHHRQLGGESRGGSGSTLQGIQACHRLSGRDPKSLGRSPS